MSETRIPEALALLREKGWCKGRFQDGDAHCINGALLEMWGIELTQSLQHPGFVSDHRAIRLVIQSNKYPETAVTGFNDDPATTFEMVEAVLEKAALERGGAL